MLLHADSKDSDQTGRISRLIGVFNGRKGHFVGFVVGRLKLEKSTERAKIKDTSPLLAHGII